MRLWIDHRAPAEPGVQLLCLPHAGGASTQYRPWRNQLPTDVAVSAADLPGRGRLAAEKPTTDMGELVSRLAAELDLDPDVPVVIFGHSLGASIGYELARSLWDRVPVAGLIASGRDAPWVTSFRPLLHTLHDEQLWDTLTQFGGVPPEIAREPELAPVLLPTLRAELTLAETHRTSPDPSLQCWVRAYTGLGDQLVTEAGLEGWACQAGDDFAVRRFPGGHFFVQHSSRAVVDAIRSDLAVL